MYAQWVSGSFRHRSDGSRLEVHRSNHLTRAVEDVCKITSFLVCCQEQRLFIALLVIGFFQMCTAYRHGLVLCVEIIQCAWERDM